MCSCETTKCRKACCKASKQASNLSDRTRDMRIFKQPGRSSRHEVELQHCVSSRTPNGVQQAAAVTLICGR